MHKKFGTVGLLVLSLLTTSAAIASAQVKKTDNVEPNVVKMISTGFSSVPGIPSGAVPEEISQTPISGLYQVVYGSNVYYMDATGQYVVQGGIVNTKNGANIGDAKMMEITKKYISGVDLKDAVKHVKGNGSRIIYTFEDPNCGYCKKLYQEMATLQNATIYTFPVGFLGEPSAEKSRRILCTEKGREDIWSLMMMDKAVPNGDASCEAGAVSLAKNSRHAQKLGVIGTPTIIFKDGSRIGGYVASAEIEKRLSSIK